MPTHYHLVLKQTKPNGISRFVGNVQNSYSRYFNIKHKRKGPLWEGKFRSVLVDTDEQLLHLTRYVHLNPGTANIINDPSDWTFTSYHEYVGISGTKNNKVCQWGDILPISEKAYEDFVKSRISYQRELSILKSIALE